MGDTSVSEIGYNVIREDQYHIISSCVPSSIFQFSLWGDSHSIRNKIKNDYELNGNKNN